jgi:4-methyl-5(b-hydroxyethyl)-thiazole monophosphate biosynthesis
MVRVLVPLAEGFEEIEAVTIIDVLRRAGIEVVVAALASAPVTGSHAIAVVPDVLLGDVEPQQFEAVVLPGGPGVVHLQQDERIGTLLTEMHQAGRWTAAICAAPTVLSQAGLLSGRRATSYPGVRDALDVGEYLETSVVVDGRVVTSRGVGTALEFALGLVVLLVSRERAEDLARAMVVSQPLPVLN